MISEGERGKQYNFKGSMGNLSEKQKNEDRNVLILAEKPIDKIGSIL